MTRSSLHRKRRPQPACRGKASCKVHYRTQAAGGAKVFHRKAGLAAAKDGKFSMETFWPANARLAISPLEAGRASAGSMTPVQVLLDTGHFALETHAVEIGTLMRGFLERHGI